MFGVPPQACAWSGFGSDGAMLTERGPEHRRCGFWAPALLWLPAGVVAYRRRALLDEPRGLDADAAGDRRYPWRLAACRSPWRAGSCGGWVGAASSLGDGGGARRGDGAAGGGTVRPARDSRLGGRSQPPGLDGLVVAPRSGLKSGSTPGRLRSRAAVVRPSPRSGPPPPAAGRQYVLPAAGRRHVQGRPPALTPRR